MPLRILSSPSACNEIAEELRCAIEGAIPNAEIEVRATGGGHFEIDVTSEAFAGKSRVARQQRVYQAIAPLMKGDAAPVHAIDRLQTKVPGDGG